MRALLAGSRLQRRRTEQSGYAAVMVALMVTVLFALAAFTVDVGRWYLTGHEMQRAADAGALAGVIKLPGDPGAAFASAKDYTKRNGFDDASASTTVLTAVDGQPTRLRVTVTDTVDNVFGSLLGIPSTTLTRTAVADYAGPVAMGNPCNNFGDDPLATTSTRGTACGGVNGQFWANVAGPASPKSNGDQFQGNCTGSAGGTTGCSGGVNTDYDPNGYFYTVNVERAISNLQIQIFDPALIDVGDLCDRNLGGSPAATAASNTRVPGTEETIRYAAGTGPFCTGDIRFGGTGQVATRFQVRGPSATPWDPLSYDVLTAYGCTRTYPGFTGNLYQALHAAHANYNDYVASNFRQWSTLCTIPYAAPGEYLIQVNTNGFGADAASGHNRFAMRAFSPTDSTARDSVSISGRAKMDIYANLPSAQTQFYLARVLPGAAGQTLNLTFFDVGDVSGGGTGTITVSAPPDSNATFSNCIGSGVVNGNLPACQITASSSFNGKVQVISAVIPANYTCDQTITTGCWVRLTYNYSGTQPLDTTAWQAAIEGDPVRLVE